MATIVCQGLQSCLESQLVESRTLTLRLSSPQSLFSHSLELARKPTESNEIRFQNPDDGGWSFLQDLSYSSPVEKENVFVHPLTNRYSSKLSEKSLELCTESLGCETGSRISSESSFLFESLISSSSESEKEEEDEGEQVIVRNSNSKSNQNQIQLQHKPCRSSEAINRTYPPPLTTMSGAESLQVTPRREGGRLIITAVKAPAVRSCFQAERSDGRLRLSFVQDPASNFDYDGNDDEEEVENEGYEEEEMGEGNGIEEEEEDTEGNKSIVGGETGKEIEIRRRIRRCKEGEMEKNGLLNWEPFWVST